MPFTVPVMSKASPSCGTMPPLAPACNSHHSCLRTMQNPDLFWRLQEKIKQARVKQLSTTDLLAQLLQAPDLDGFARANAGSMSEWGYPARMIRLPARRLDFDFWMCLTTDMLLSTDPKLFCLDEGNPVLAGNSS